MYLYLLLLLSQKWFHYYISPATHLVIIESMLDLFPVHVDGVVVVLRVHNQTTPFPPARWNVRTVVLVQVFAEITWNAEKDFS